MIIVDYLQQSGVVSKCHAASLSRLCVKRFQVEMWRVSYGCEVIILTMIMFVIIIVVIIIIIIIIMIITVIKNNGNSSSRGGCSNDVYDDNNTMMMMMMMMMIAITLTIILIELKGTFSFLFLIKKKFFSAPRCVSNTHVRVANVRQCRWTTCKTPVRFRDGKDSCL